MTPHPPESTGASDCRVLVVDDDFMVARIHRRFVEALPGFTVVAEARNGADALAAVEQHRPDVVLLDIYLPDVNGIEVLRRIREAEVPVDVIAVSAARDVDTVREAVQGGVAHYLVKPFDGETLQERLIDVDRRRRLLRRAEQGSGEVGQRDLDRIFRGTRPRTAAPERLPKGLSAATLDLVRSAMREHASGRDETLSAAECADRVGLARVSVRRYLEHLVTTGSVEVALRYGTGRPERRYRWTGP